MNQKEEWLKKNNVDVETSIENMIDFDTYYENEMMKKIR